MGTLRQRAVVRGVIVLAIGMVAAGALASTPATSAVDGLSKKEKKQGDKRWINIGEKAADADKLDGKDSTDLGPVAYAHVSFTGTLDAANSKGVAGTSLYTASTDDNYFCIDLAPGVSFKNIQVTPDAAGNVNAAAYAGDPFTSCAPFVGGMAAGDVTVQTFSGATPTASAFWILFT